MKNIEAIIKKAVNEGIEAGRRQAERAPVNVYRATERRLYALPDLREKVAADKEHLKNLTIQRHSNDIVRFQRSGRRLTDDELLEALAQDLRATIAANEFEIKTIENALDPLTSDPYYRALEGKYFEQRSDEKLAVEMHCDPSTVRRNRGRLVRRVAVRLYGVTAV